MIGVLYIMFILIVGAINFVVELINWFITKPKEAFTCIGVLLIAMLIFLAIFCQVYGYDFFWVLSNFGR